MARQLEHNEQQPAEEVQAPSQEATGARTCSREESRQRRVARRAVQQGYELDDEARGVVRALCLQEEAEPVAEVPLPPPLLMLQAAGEPVQTEAGAEAVVEPIPVVMAEQAAEVVLEACAAHCGSA